MTRVTIADFVEKINQSVCIDVRSPLEYNHAHMPSAINLPLFTDEERKIVGTAYKQQSREIAIKIGLDIFGPKMRTIVEQVEAIAKDDKTVYVYCARGGMRSAAISWLLNLYGFKITTLVGGYKAFRNWTLQQFNVQYDIKILGGYTGSGKTKLLQLKDNFVDLEGLAHHKGSAFGNIGLPVQPSQEMFENKLAMALHIANKNSNPIWLEDESQRIGLNNLPKGLWLQMRTAEVDNVTISFAERLNNIVMEYGVLPKDQLQAAIERIQKRLGGLETKNALQHLADNDIEKCFAILLHYYDKQYQKGLDKRKEQPKIN
jgi:tRNA 2-selenouridine synthase